VAAAAGLTPDHMRWIPSRHTFFLPVKVLSRVFRGKFVAGLKNAFHHDKLAFYGHLAPLAEPLRVERFKRSISAIRSTRNMTPHRSSYRRTATTASQSASAISG
jgi:Putative transposase